MRARQRRAIVMLGPDYDEHGGVASVIRGYRDAGLAEQWPLMILASHRHGSAATKLLTWGLAWGRFARLVLAGRCGALHLHTASRASFWRKYSFYLLARAAGIPVIWHVHGGQFDRFLTVECSTWQRRLACCALSRGWRVIALSSKWAEFLQEICPGANVVVIPNGVAVAEGAATVERRACSVLFMGRIIQPKGVFDLLAAVQRIATAVPEIRLRIAGSGESDKVIACARQLGIADRVEMLGWISGQARDDALAQAAVLVLPSYAEGLPTVLLEAMALATPVIATSVGGVPDLVSNEENGLLVAPADVAALALALQRMLTDPFLAGKLGCEGQGRVLRDFSMKSVLASLGRIYRGMGLSPGRW